MRFSQIGNQQWETILTSSSQTEKLGRVFGENCTGGEVLTLTGELGVGKTTFVRGLAIGVGILPEVVSSPTFTIIQEYEGHPALIHVDLYRLDHQSEIEDIGLSEYFGGHGVVVIEWADRLSSVQLPDDYTSIHLTHKKRYARQATLQAVGSRSLHILDTMSQDLDF